MIDHIELDDAILTAEKLIDYFEEFNTITHIDLQNYQLIDHDIRTKREIDELLELDPILVPHWLRMVNSAYYGVHYRIESISKEVEHATIGTDHCLVGSLLAARWKFLERVKQAILEHHTVRTRKSDLTHLPGIVQIAHYLADTTGYREIPERMEPPVGIVASHITPEATAYRVLARDSTEEMGKAASFYEVDAA